MLTYKMMSASIADKPVTLCHGRRRPRAPTATVCMYSMYAVTELGENVNGTSKFCVPWAVSLEQFAINSARQQFVSESVQGAAKDVSLRSWTITNTIRRCWDFFVIVAPSINVHTYLLTYLLTVLTYFSTRICIFTTH